jgi:hypothetical protein
LHDSQDLSSDALPPVLAALMARGFRDVQRKPMLEAEAR